MKVKIIKSNRGEDILEYNNHIFYFAYKTKTTNIIRWRFTCHRKCSAKLFTKGENMTIVRDESVHINHDEKIFYILTFFYFKYFIFNFLYLY